MIAKWHDERNSVIENWHINRSRKDDRELKTIQTKKKQNSFIEIMQYKENNKKNFDERKYYNQEMQKMIDVVKVRSSIERQENNNRKDDMIEPIQKNPSAIIQKKIDIIDGDKEEK